MQLDHHEIINKKHDLKVVIIAESIISPENIGMIFRNADAFGVEKVYLSGNSPVELNKKIKKVSRNTIDLIDHEYVSDSLEIIEKYRSLSYRIIALEYCKNSIPVQELKVRSSEKMVMILGSEKDGIKEQCLEICDDIVHINMFGKNSSINVANAAGITLFEITKHS